MGVSLSGVEAWGASDQLEPGTYCFQPASIEREESSNGNPMVKVQWRVVAGAYRGSELRDKITLTPNTRGRVAQILEAAGIPAPTQEFESYGQLADWLAGALKGCTVEGIVRMEPWHSDPTKESPAIKGYQRPLEGSDVPADGPSNGAGVQTDSKPLPF
jgi:hypothetical protein